MKNQTIHAGLLAVIALACFASSAYAYRDLETGTFLARDPAGFVDGPNVYTYVRQNPWSGYDPQGLFVRWLVEKANTHVFESTFGRAGRWVANSVMTSGQVRAYANSGVHEGLTTAQTVVHGGLDFVSPGSGTLDTIEAGGDLGDIANAAVNDFGTKKIRTAVAGSKAVVAGAQGDTKGVLSAAGELAMSKATKGKPGGKSQRDIQANSKAAAERAKNLEEGIPANQLGPSGKPKVHVVRKPTDKRAKEAARQHGKSKPVKHTQDAGQPAHYHGTDRAGEKLKGKDNVHFQKRGEKPNPPKREGDLSS